MVAAVVLTSGLFGAHANSALDEGLSLAQRGDIQGALAAYAKAIAAHPEDPEGHARLGGMQLINKQYSHAVQRFQAAIRLGDEGARVFVGMGMAYLHTGQYRAARAALLEAKRRGSQRSDDLDRVLAWLDGRSPPAPEASPP